MAKVGRPPLCQVKSDIFFVHPRPSNRELLSTSLSARIGKDTYVGPPWKGREIFSGPESRRDYRMRVAPDYRYVGIGDPSPELTSEINYVWRSGPNTPFPRPRSCYVGEVGWGVHLLADWTVPNTGHQITMAEFRQRLEDSNTHRFQTPWYPSPWDQEEGEEGEGGLEGTDGAPRSHAAVPRAGVSARSGSKVNKVDTVARPILPTVLTPSGRNRYTHSVARPLWRRAPASTLTSQSVDGPIYYLFMPQSNNRERVTTIDTPRVYTVDTPMYTGLRPCFPRDPANYIRLLSGDKIPPRVLPYLPPEKNSP